MKTLLTIVAVALLALIAAAYVLVRFNADKLAGLVSDRVQQATGQAFVLSDLGLSFYPRFGVSFGEGRWGDPRQDRISAAVRNGSLRLAIGPLLHGRFELDEIFLNEPYIRINPAAPRRHSGRQTAIRETASESPGPGAEKDAPASSSFDLSGITLARVEIRGGRFEFPIGTDVLELRKVNLLFESANPDQRSGALDVSAGLSLFRSGNELTVPLALKGHLRLEGSTGLALEQLDAELGETRASGGVSLKLPAIVTADLEMDALDLNPYLKWFSEKPADSPAEQDTAVSIAPAGEVAAPALVARKPMQPEADIALRIGSLRAGKVDFSAVRARLMGKEGCYKLAPCDFNLFQGAVKVQAGMEAEAQPCRFTLNVQAWELNLAEASAALAGRGYAGGTLSLNAFLKTAGSDPKAIKSGLVGNGTLTGRAVAVETAWLPQEIARRIGGNRVIFDTLEGVFAADKGVIAVRRLDLTGSVLGVRATGKVDLPEDQLELDGILSLARLSLPMKISGALSRPAVKIDTRRLLLDTLQGVGGLLPGSRETSPGADGSSKTRDL